MIKKDWFIFKKCQEPFAKEIDKISKEKCSSNFSTFKISLKIKFRDTNQWQIFTRFNLENRPRPGGPPKKL